MADWLDPEELRVFRAFNTSWVAMMARLDQELQNDIGLSRTYFEILWRLRHAPGQAMRMTELAEQTESKPSRMTHAIGRLEADGLVRREVSAGDRRGWSAVLTEQGAALIERAMPRYARSIRENFFAPLSPDMQADLVRIGKALLAHVDPSKLHSLSDGAEAAAGPGADE
ncbi:MarR family winged helix-turn-helix transcriptional regulator [Pseudonocardia spinosispora]|uniref:MarR family winged helix-turn-helix transcriptional regulator n=1 Tax=Pseudonocardia spinosispora TaxID=103441 RepID=UPI000417257C|nr:MarR family transcriptional regulator [Pseudonocardia spinosispora]